MGWTGSLHGLALGLIVFTGSVGAKPIRVADGYLLDRWTTADGLPVNGTTAVRIGRSGYLWLTTFDGLVRFDGNRFTVFNASRNPGLPGNRLITLTETPDGSLWVTTQQYALARFDGDRFQTFGRDQGLPSPRVLTTHVDAGGTLWVGTERGLARLEGERFRPWAPESVSGTVWAIVTSTDGRVWVGTDHEGLIELRGETLRRRYTQRDGVPKSIRALALDASRSLWIGGLAGLARLRDGSIERFAEFDRRGVAALQSTPGGDVLVQGSFATYRWHDGAWRTLREQPTAAIVEMVGVAPDGAEWTVHQNVLARQGEEVLEAPCPIRGLAFDDTGAVWLATGCDGLWRLREREVMAVTAEQGLPAGPVYGLARSHDGTLWAATPGGTVSAVRTHPDDQQEAVVHRVGPRGQYVGAVMADPDGGIWVGEVGLCVLADGGCEEPPGLPSQLRGQLVYALFRSDDGSLWVGSATGLWRHHGDGWQAMDERLAASPRMIVRAITQTRSGNLWFVTDSDGLRRLTAAGGVSRYSLEQGLASAAVRDVYEDPHRRLWVATEDRGLCRSRQPEDAPELSFTCLSTAQGLHSDSLHRILPDDSGRLWFNSNAGVFWIEREALERVLDGRDERVYPHVYTERDGLPDREGNGGVQNAGLRLADGRLAFPGQGGIAIIDPRKVRADPVSPRVAIEHLLLPGGRSVPVPADSPVVPDLTLPRGDRVFSVRFTGLTPGLTAPLYFRYRLRPNGEAWTEIGGDRLLSFERLPPGRYQLEIAAVDAASGATGPVARMRLHLPAYFYETMTFRIGLVLCLLAAALIALWRYHRAAAARQRKLEAEVDRGTAEARTQQRVAERAQGAAEEALRTVERQRAEIEALAEARTRFFGNISHELRTPLTLLVGPLRDQVGGTPPPAPLAEVMLRNARRLERLVEQLLDLERIDARRFPLRPVDLDLTNLARDSATAFAALAKRLGLELETRLDGEPVPVRADPDQISRVLGNLLSNALKFTPEGGHVRLTLRTLSQPEAADGEGSEPPGQVELTVEDTGPGVPPEWRERIFDRFSQMGRRDTRAREGAGLGLALCREVVELHRGRLFVEPTDGDGSRFVLHLPLAATLPPGTAPVAVTAHLAAAEAEAGEALHMPAAATRSRDDTQKAADERHRVLIAEDEADLRRYIEDLLAGDYDTQAVEDGEAALIAARREPPDAIVSDIVMPRRDGLGLARALRTDPELAGVPLIFLTARASDADEIEGLAIGADQYLKKPFQSDVLRAHVAAAIRTCQRLRDQFAGEPPTPEPRSDEVQERARTWIESNAHDDTLSVEALAAALNMSRTTLHRKLVGSTGQAPGDFIRAVRLARARRLLREGAGTVSEIAYGVGFVSLSGFTRAYRTLFGEPPSQSLQQS